MNEYDYLIDKTSVYRKRKRRNRLNDTVRVNTSRMDLCKAFRKGRRWSSFPYYICDAKRLCTYTYVVEPAYDESESYYIRESCFWGTSNDGSALYMEIPVKKYTGRIIHHPSKLKRKRVSSEYVPCTPYLQHSSKSNRKSFDKKYSHKIERQMYRHMCNDCEDYEDICIEKNYNHKWY